VAHERGADVVELGGRHSRTNRFAHLSQGPGNELAHGAHGGEVRFGFYGHDEKRHEAAANE
jgi:hypothetical protein